MLTPSAQQRALRLLCIQCSESLNGTEPESRQFQEKIGGVAPAGVFSWFVLEIARLLNSSKRTS
jgi:hypothetical protein